MRRGSCACAPPRSRSSRSIHNKQPQRTSCVFRYRPRSELPEAEHAKVLQCVRDIEEAWHIAFPAGYNEQLQLMGHLWEPLRVFHKPLLVHLASEGSMFVTHLLLQARRPAVIVVTGRVVPARDGGGQWCTPRTPARYITPCVGWRKPPCGVLVDVCQDTIQTR